MLQDVCAKTWSRNFLCLLCQGSITSCWALTMALFSLLVVSQSLLHWPETIDGEILHEEQLEESELSFLFLLCRAFLSICGARVCEWKGMAFQDIRLETKSSQEICTDLLMTLSWATFTMPLLVSQVCLFLPRSQSLKIIYMRSKKSPKLGKFPLMQIPINANSHHIFCVSYLSDTYAAYMSIEDRPQQRAVICSTYPVLK